MATITAVTPTSSTANVTSYPSNAFTPAANDLLVVMVEATTVDPALAPGTLTDSQGLGFTKIDSIYHSGNTPKALYLFVADSLAAATSMTVTFDCTGDTGAGAIIQIWRVAGMSRTGASAVKQYTKANATATPPAPSFSANCDTNNPTIGGVVTLVSPANMTPPTGWTESGDTGHANPTVGMEACHRNSGFTGTTMTWLSSVTLSGVVIIAELDTSVAAQNLSQTTSESISTGESLGEILVALEAITEALSISESAEPTVEGAAGAVDCTTSENIGTSESDIRQLTLLRTSTEGPAAAMVAARAIAEPRTVTDALSAALSVARLLVLTKTSTDVISTSMTSAALKIKITAATDALSTAMTAARLLILLRTTADAPISGMTAARLLVALRAIVDALSTSELASRQILHGVITREALDAATVSELASRILQAARNGVDALSAPQSVNRNVSFNRSLTETRSLSEVITRSLLSSRLVSDLAQTSDGATLSGFTVSRFSADLLSILESVSIPIGAVYATDHLTTSDAGFWFMPQVVKILLAVEPPQVVRINTTPEEPVQINIELL